MPAHPADAATILLVRDAPQLEVLMVERNAALAFGPGALVFPGGKLDAQDRDPAWAAHVRCWSQIEPASRALRLCAIREAFEETGILLGAGDRPWADIAAQASALRPSVCSGDMPFIDVVEGLRWTLDLPAAVPFARWITPQSAPIRFDATFFIAHAPPGQIASCDGRETVDAEWIAPPRALELAKAGKRHLMPPTLTSLQRLATAQGADAAVEAARGRPLVTQQRD